MKIKTAAAALIACLMLITAACGNANNNSGNGNSSGPSPSGNTGEDVTIRISWWGGQARHDMMNILLDKFEEKYPHIQVEREFGTQGQYAEKIATQAAGRNAPDVIQSSSSFIGDFVSRGIQMDLQPLVDSGDLSLADYPAQDIEGAKVDGKLYMVTIGHSIEGIVYNKAIFEQAGVQLPQNGWTWDEYVQTMQDVQQSLGGDAWASEDEGGQYRGLDFFLAQRGKSIFHDGGLGFDKQDLIDWYSFWDGLRKLGVVPPASIQSEQGDKPQEQSMLARGSVAMVRKSSNQLKIFQKATSDPLGIVSFPVDPAAEKVFPLVTTGLGISPDSKHQQEAALLINFIAHDPDAAPIFRGEQGPQPSPKMQAVIYDSLTDIEKDEYAYVNDILEFTKPYPVAPAGGNSVQSLVLTENEAVAYGQKTVEQAVDDFFTQAQQILNR